MNTPNYEYDVIGSVLLDPSTIDTVRLTISYGDFADDRLAAFFALLCDLHDLGKPVNDLHLVTTEAGRRQLTPPAAEIAEMFTAVPTSAHAVFYAENVAEASRLRRLARLVDEIRDRVLAKDESDSVISFAESRLKSINSSTRIEIDDAETIAETYQPENRSEVMAFSGLERLDQKFGGFTGSELICLAARLGCGKTALGWQVMLHSLKRSRPCLFVSLEMRSGQLFERHLSSATGISSLRIRSGELSSSERGLVENEREKFRNYPASIFAPPSATVRQIAAAAKLKQSGGGLSLLVIDYYQLIRASTKRNDRRAELEEISRELKTLAGELNVPVVVLAQLNRQADNVKPRVAQIAESDNIGRDADQVWLLHRQAETTDIRVSKHRYVQDDAVFAYRYDCGCYRDPNEFVGYGR